MLAAGCAAPSQPPLTVVTDESSDLPLRLAGAELKARFVVGDAQFDEVYRPADGLGPVYIRAQCSACHQAAGRGPGFVMKMSGSADSLQFGHTERPRSVDGATPLLAPADAGVLLTQRSAPAVFGRGYLEAIADTEIEAVEAKQRAVGSAVSGRINRVTYNSEANPESPFHSHQKGQGGLIGRFGLKARIASLDEFAADAMQGDMGLTSPLRPDELPNPDGRLDDGKAGIDVPLSVVNELGDYMRLLELPNRPVTDPAATALFDRVGCSACHVPSLKTRSDYPLAPLAGIDAWVYCDLLLHDMGPALSDGLVDGDAEPGEWRTAPLIGLRFLPSYLHDGRADSVEQAIVLHGGEGSEAKASVDAFEALSADDRALLLKFVSAL